MTRVSGEETYTGVDGTHLLYGSTVSETGWKMYIDLKEKNLLHDVHRLMIIFVVSSVVALVLTVLLVLLFARNLARAVRTYSVFADSVAAGDLVSTLNERETGRKDELGVIGRALQEMSTRLKDVVQGVQANAHQVSSSSDSLLTFSRNVSSEAGNVARAVEEGCAGSL